MLRPSAGLSVGRSSSSASIIRRLSQDRGGIEYGVTAAGRAVQSLNDVTASFSDGPTCGRRAIAFTAGIRAFISFRTCRDGPASRQNCSGISAPVADTGRRAARTVRDLTWQSRASRLNLERSRAPQRAKDDASNTTNPHHGLRSFRSTRSRQNSLSIYTHLHREHIAHPQASQAIR